jgi:purine-binding chemotaxis protein CheW
MIDWTAVYRRLEATREYLASGWNLSPEKAKEILRARARKLAEEPRVEEPGEIFLEVLEFSLAKERYGVETAFVREVYPLKDPTSLPGTPPFVLGIMNIRGRILSVLDIKKFFDLPEKGLTELNKVIVLRSASMEFGILADEIVGVRTIAAASLQQALPTMTGVRVEYLMGLTPDGSVILHADKLLSDKNLIVFQEIEGV